LAFASGDSSHPTILPGRLIFSHPTDPAHRRVLQVDFSADELPGGLAWLGV
jgi:hypothetical protein